MLWRHLFEEHLHSPSFIEPQIDFEQLVYKKMLHCYEKEGLSDGERRLCVEKWEGKMQNYAVAVQWVITQR